MGGCLREFFSLCCVLVLALLVVSTVAERHAVKYRGAMGTSLHRTGKGLSVRYSSHLFQDKVLYFDQKVDHFNPIDSSTWKQKFIVYDQNWVPGGPVFFFLGGEAPIEFFGFQEVYPRLLTKQFGALYVALEHRFYGSTMPTRDFSTHNLRLLSSRQALADAAHFLVSFNKTLTEAGPWIVWGCSYSGALSAWFRAKYPNLVIGSIAPSGPTEALLNFTAYYGQFSKSAYPACVSVTQQATNQLMAHIATPSGRQVLQRTFNACEPIGDTRERQYYFLLTLTEALGSSDQFQNPPAFPLNQTCDIMLGSNNLLANWAKVLAQSQDDFRSSQADCNDFDEERSFIRPMRNVSNADRAWMFQQCTEFGFFMPTYPGSSVFPPVLDLEHQVKWCEQIYGIKGMTPDIEGINSYYGGYNLRGSGILFTNGWLDPWHNLSINKDLPPPNDVHAVNYDAGHCATMTAATAEDPVSLTNARTVVANFISNLLVNA